MTRSSRLFAKIIAGLIMSFTISCGNGGGSTTAPNRQAEFADYWPVAEGEVWKYDLNSLEGDPTTIELYSQPEVVPELPGLDELYTDLQASIDWEDASVRQGDLTLTMEAVEQQSPGVKSGRLNATVDNHGGASIRAPLPLTSCLWTLEADRIAAYDIWLSATDPDLYWVYLMAEMAPGTEFSTEVLSSLGDGITLSGKVMRTLTMNTDGDDVSCVEVAYSIDFGVEVQFGGVGGDDERYFRIYAAGEVVYGNGVGPIRVRERRINANVLQDSGPAVVETLATLK